MNCPQCEYTRHSEHAAAMKVAELRSANWLLRRLWAATLVALVIAVAWGWAK